MRPEHPRQAIRRERVDRVERLGRRWRLESDELGRAVEPNQGVGDVELSNGGVINVVATTTITVAPERKSGTIASYQ